MTLNLQIAGKSDVGCVRSNNEDNFGYDARHGIFVVCDGMGGQAAGEVASKMGVDALLNFFRDYAEKKAPPVKAFDGVSDRANALGSAIMLANASVYQASHGGQKEHAGMGSTVAAVLIDGNFLAIGHVGDSRVYLIRNGAVQYMTNDHSLVMEQVRRGLMTQQEAERSEVQNIILRALGSEETVEPELEDMVLAPGDVVLLASDGLTKHVRDENMLRIVKSTTDLDQACDALIAAAKEHGGDDNITCLLIRASKLSWYERLFGKGNRKWQNSI
jgi:serine/threonine protein phosphatase PrpC